MPAKEIAAPFPSEDLHVSYTVAAVEKMLAPENDNITLVESIFSAADLVVDRLNQRSPNLAQNRQGGVMVIASTQQDNQFMIAR
jgi:hypothetical protein